MRSGHASTSSMTRLMGGNQWSGRTHRPRRYDEPTLARGAVVSWNGERFRIESFEFQGERWNAVLVREDDYGISGAPCWFAPCSVLEELHA